MSDYVDGDYIYDTQWLAMKRAINGDAILSGLAPTLPGGMVTRLGTGSYHADATKVTVASTVDFTHSTADLTYDRWDLIWGTSAAQGKTEGAPNLIVVPPDLPAGAIILYMVRIRAGVTNITAGDLYGFGFLSKLNSHAAQHMPAGLDQFIHATHHRPGQADALPTGIPSNIGTANTEGTALGFARHDHVHNHPSGLGIDLHHPRDHANTHTPQGIDPLQGIEIAIKEVYDYTGNVFNQAVVLHPWGSPSKLADPATPPTGNGSGCSWSPNGELLAVTHFTHPYISIYQRSGTTLTKLADPATPPTGDAYDCSWSPNGEFLAVAHTTSPLISIYQRSGTTLTKLANPATLPGGTAGLKVAWSPNGEFLVYCGDSSPSVFIYQRSGTTFTKLANPASLPTSFSTGCAFSPNGEFLAISHDNTPYISIYQRSGTTFTKLANPAFLPTITGRNCSWSPNGEFLVVTYFDSPRMIIYQRSGTTFTKLADPSSPPGGESRESSWSPNGEFLAVAHFNHPYIAIYQRSGTTFTKLANPATTPTGDGRHCKWSPNGEFLAVAHVTFPFITNYQTSLNLPEKGIALIMGVKREGT